MTKKYLILIFLLLPVIAVSQSKKHRVKMMIKRYYEGYNDCIYQNLFDPSQRRGFFPFSNAVKIRLVSYSDAVENDIHIQDPDSPKIVPAAMPAEDTMRLITPIARGNYFINYCKVKEMRDLSNAAIDSLTDILYNVIRKPIKFPDDFGDPGAACYMPEHAILFIDNKGRVINYIQICFHCHKYYYSSSKTREIAFCDQKWSMLRKFFMSQGQEFGLLDLI